MSYNEKHNDANGEGNRDGESNNRSWNCGVEGPTTIKDVNDLRQQQMRNMFATLLCSQGIPMICGGDEVARTQQGNNNAYCQDNAISWTNWDLDDSQKDLLEFVSKLIHLRLEHRCSTVVVSSPAASQETRTIRFRRSNGWTTPVPSWTWKIGPIPTRSR